jgi:hypothetical protein
MTDATGGEDIWFYTHGGQRKGPVAAEKLNELLADQTINADTPIWRKGFSGWQPLRQTEIGTSLADTPPPISTSQITNGYVWTVAFTPIASLFLNIAIASFQRSYPDPNAPTVSDLILLIPAIVSCVLCLADAQKLREAGHSSSWLTFFAFLLWPVYLFARAKRLKQIPTYGFAWIGCFIISILVPVA